MKTSSQTSPAIVLVKFDDSIPLPPLTAPTHALKSAIRLYLHRVFGPETQLTVTTGETGTVTVDGHLVATFKVSPLTAGSDSANSLAVAA